MQGKKYIIITILILLFIAGVLIGYLQPFNISQARNDGEQRIAYVDLQGVFNHHPDKATAEEKLNELARNMQAELEAKAADLSEEEQQQLLEQYQQELSTREEEMVEQILTEIEHLIDKVAAEQEFKMVLDKKNVIFGGYDLTQEIIDYINGQ